MLAVGDLASIIAGSPAAESAPLAAAVLANGGAAPPRGGRAGRRRAPPPPQSGLGSHRWGGRPPRSRPTARGSAALRLRAPAARRGPTPGRGRRPSARDTIRGRRRPCPGG